MALVVIGLIGIREYKTSDTYAFSNFAFWIFFLLLIALLISFFIIKNIRNLVGKQITGQSAMESSELRYRSILENASDAIYLVDNLGRFVEVNDSMSKMTGYSKDELLKLRVEDIYDNDRIKTEPVNLPNVPYHAIFRQRRFIRKDGTALDVEINGKRLDEDTLIGVARNITERKQMEIELRDAEEKFRTLVEKSIVGVYLSQNRRLLYINERYAGIMGYEPHELIDMGEKVINNLHDKENQEIIRASAHTRYNGEDGSSYYEAVGIKKDGSKINIEVYGNVVTINGQPATIGMIADITERKRAAELILKEKNLSESIINSLPGIFYLRDGNGKGLRWNKNLETVSGYTTEEIEGTALLELVAEEDRETMQRVVEKTLNEGYLTAEIKLVTKDGCKIPYLLSKKTVNYNDQICLLGTGIDISQRVKAEKEVNRLTRLFQFISSINEAMLKATDTGQIYAEACRIAVEIGGFQMAWIGAYDKKNDRITPVAWSGHEDGFFEKINVEGMKVSESVIPSARAIRTRNQFHYNDIANDPEITPGVKHEMLKRGYLSGVSFPLFIDEEIVAAMVLLMSEPFFFNGEEIELLGNVTDNITYALDKLRIRDLQHRSEANLKSIFDTTDVSYLLLDTAYNIIALNQQMKEVYIDIANLELNEGGNLIELLLPEKREAAKAIYDRVVRTRRFTDYESTYQKNGTFRHFLANVKPIHDGNAVIGICITVIDITARKTALEKLEAANADLQKKTKELAASNTELEEFAYVASHDLQEPLRMVTGFLTQLESKYGDSLDEKAKKYIFYATDGAKRMRQIILDLLEYSRVGRNDDKPEKVDFNALMNEVLPLYRRSIEELNATIHIEQLPVLHSYKTPVRQVLQNLLSNALKYTRDGVPPEITVSSKETPTDFEFSVQDNGIGIDPEYFNQIFVIFKRLHNRDRFPGTGMGLAITKKIVENMGGRIWLDSHEGEGSVFHFTIPKHTGQ